MLAREHLIGAAWAGRKLPPTDIDPQKLLLPLDPPLTHLEFIGRYAAKQRVFIWPEAETALAA